MEGKDIIKALQLCTSGDIYCKECPYEDTPRCRYVSLVDALDLIRTQWIRIQNLTDEKKQLETDIANANMNCDHVTHELERANKLIEQIREDLCITCDENAMMQESAPRCDACIYKRRVSTKVEENNVVNSQTGKAELLQATNCTICAHFQLCMYIASGVSDFKFPQDGGKCDMFQNALEFPESHYGGGNND